MSILAVLLAGLGVLASVSTAPALLQGRLTSALRRSGLAALLLSGAALSAGSASLSGALAALALAPVLVVIGLRISSSLARGR